MRTRVGNLSVDTAPDAIYGPRPKLIVHHDNAESVYNSREATPTEAALFALFEEQQKQTAILERILNGIQDLHPDARR